MRYIEVLCEGSSDVPALREVLTRRFGLSEGDEFRIHPHRGKGKLPAKEHLLKPPAPSDNSLLRQLPIKLKNYGQLARPDYEVAVIVVVDADEDDCRALKGQLVELYNALPSKPAKCLFRIAVEETESWFIAEPAAVKQAYPTAKTDAIGRLDADAVCGAWEQLARALKRDPTSCGGGEKTTWATKISPFLELRNAQSPSLRALVEGIEKLLS